MVAERAAARGVEDRRLPLVAAVAASSRCFGAFPVSAPSFPGGVGGDLRPLR